MKLWNPLGFILGKSNKCEKKLFFTGSEIIVKINYQKGHGAHSLEVMGEI